MNTQPEPSEPADDPLTPGEALAKLFLDNADHGRNAANDELVEALLQRTRAIQELADLIPKEGRDRDSPSV